jgi:hypothetical protein
LANRDQRKFYLETPGPTLSLPGVDSRPWSPPRHSFVMLATTRMTKSFKMVLLRVLLDNDTVFSGMPIPELAAKCREFLVAHEFPKPARGSTSSWCVNLSPPYS